MLGGGAPMRSGSGPWTVPTAQQSSLEMQATPPSMAPLGPLTRGLGAVVQPPPVKRAARGWISEAKEPEVVASPVDPTAQQSVGLRQAAAPRLSPLGSVERGEDGALTHVAPSNSWSGMLSVVGPKPQQSSEPVQATAPGPANSTSVPGSVTTVHALPSKCSTSGCKMPSPPFSELAA